MPFVKNFILAPGFRHVMAKDNGGNYYNWVHTNFYTFIDLPFGIGFENNMYNFLKFYNHDFQRGPNQTKDKEFQIVWESYLYKTFDLYKADKYNFTLNFEGGYDAYSFSQYGRYSKNEETGIETFAEKNSYSLYALFDISMNYQLTDAISLTSGIAAEYRNWDIEDEGKAKNWRWQPQVFAMLKTKF